jgi:hypothetical protein
MRTPLVILVVLIAFACGTTMAIAGSNGNNGNNGTVGHKEKPGCGPDKTDGVAGASGRHTGQPPKADNRQDCPNPPGQQNQTQSSTSSSKKTK